MAADEHNSPNDGRSAERTRQDETLEHAARHDSWVGQLLRKLKLSKGRPKGSAG